MRRIKIPNLAKSFILMLAAISGVLASVEVSAIEPDANRIIRAMGEYLKNAGEFSFHADITYDETIFTGEKVKYGATTDITARRPDRLRVTSEGDEFAREVYYDGKTITMFDVRNNLYAITEVPGELDGAMDMVFDKFGLVVPVADFLYADPYAVLTENAVYGSLIGEHACGEKRCHHLLFTQEWIDWQIWVETGPRPLPRRLVITYKHEPDSPQYEAWLSQWDFQPASEQAFTFYPPDGANQIEFLPAPAETDAEENQP